MAAASPPPTSTSLTVGQRVVVAQRTGTVRFTGNTKFAAGLWIGVALDEKVGKNNGTVQGVAYFDCDAEHGIFIRANLVQTLEEAEAAGTARKSVRRGSQLPGSQPVVPAEPAKASPAEPASPMSPKSATAPARKSVQPDASTTAKANPPPPASPPDAGAAAKANSSSLPASSSAVPVADPRSSEKRSSQTEGSKAQAAQQILESHTTKVQTLRERVAQLHEQLNKEKKQMEEAETRRTSAQASQLEAADPETAAVAEELRVVKSAVGKLQGLVDTARAEIGKLDDTKKRLAKESELMAPSEEGGPEKIPELQQFLQKIQLEKELQDNRALSLKLDLEEIKLIQEEDKALAAEAAKMANKSMFVATSRQIVEYQSALKVLQATSQREKLELQARADALEREAEKISGLKQTTEQLASKQKQLQQGIIEMEREATEMFTLQQTFHQLQDAQAAIASELRRELDHCDGRVDKLATFVMKMHREQHEVECAIKGDTMRADELTLQLQKLAAASKDASEDIADSGNLLRHAHIVAFAVRQRLGALAASAAGCRADAFMECIPESYSSASEKGGTFDKEVLSKVASAATTISSVEACFCRAEALAAFLCKKSLAMLPPGNGEKAKWLCSLCLASSKCAAAAAIALSRLQALPPESDQKLKERPTEVIIPEKEGNLGLSVKGVPPAKSLPVQKVAADSLAAKHEIKPGSTLIAVQQQTTEKMTLDTFKTLMKQRPLTLTLKPPQEDSKSSSLSLSLDLSTCTAVQAKLDELLSACRQGSPDAQPVALQSLAKLEQQFTELQKAGQADEGEGETAPRSVVALTLRRIEAIYRYGLNIDNIPQPMPGEGHSESDESGVEDESAKQTVKKSNGSRVKLVSRLSETASRLQAAEDSRQLSGSSGVALGPQESGLPVDALKLLLQKTNAMEAALQSGTAILNVLDEAVADVSHGLDAVAKTWPANKRQSSASHFHGPPVGWARVANDIQREIDKIFEVQQQVIDGRASLVEQKRAEEVAKKGLEEKIKKKAEMQQEVDQLNERCKACAALDAEAEKLSAQAKEDTSAQAALQQKLDDTCKKREEQESSSRDGAAKLAALERDLEERRRRPHGELEGQATAQELATLRHRSVKGARELYALQVNTICNLPPLLAPTPVPSTTTRALESCLTDYAEIRRELLFEWAETRLTQLEPDPEPDQAPKPKPLLNPATMQLGRIQQLQVQLNTLRQKATPLAEAAPVAAVPNSANSPSVQVKLELPCPQWVAMPPNMGAPLSLTFEELQRLHAVMA